MINRLRNKLNHDIHLKEIFIGSAITFVLKMSGMLLGYLVILIISRQYGPEGVGIYNLTLSIMTLVAMMAAMGLDISILRYVGQFNKNGEEHKLKLLYYYSIELVLPFSLLLAMLLYLFSGVIAQNVFHNSAYKSALEIAAIIIPFMALQNIGVEFIRGLKQLKISEFLRSVNRPLVNIILLLSLGFFVVNQLLPLYTLGVGVIVSATFTVYFIAKRVRKFKTKEREIFSKKELVTTSLPMMITTVFSFVMGNISLFMLEIFSTTEEVGIFSVVLKIAMMISLVLVVVNTISAPKFSELFWAKKYDELQYVISNSTNTIFYSSLFLSVLVLLFSEPILILFGENFLFGNMALMYLLIGQLINSATGSVGYFMNMSGKEKAYRNITIFTLILSLILNLILIPSYGLNGAAIATFISVSILNVSAALYVKYTYNIKTYYSPILKR